MKENGVIRRRLSGKEADPYIGLSRKILGEMKNIMQYGGIKQLSWTKDLQNGVRIVVSSIFGRDEVRILVPVSSVSRLKGKMEERIIKSTQEIIFVWHSGFVRRITGSRKEDIFDTDYNRIVPKGVSKDATTVYGYWNINGAQKGFYWTQEEGKVSISDTAEFIGSSKDGIHLLGYGSDYGKAIIYHKGEGTEYISYIGSTLPIDISADGNTIVWSETTGPGTNAHIWTREAGGENIGFFIPSGISGDGKTVFGNKLLSLVPVVVYGGAFWTAETGLVEASPVPLGFRSCVFLASSHDGSVLVGLARNDGTPEGVAYTIPVVWTKSSGLKAISGSYTLGSDVSNMATDVSEDGSVVVGTANLSEIAAFRWTNDSGMQNVDSKNSLGTVVATWIAQTTTQSTYNEFVPE